MLEIEFCATQIFLFLLTFKSISIFCGPECGVWFRNVSLDLIINQNRSMKNLKSTFILGITYSNQICTLGHQVISLHLCKYLMQNLQLKRSALGDLVNLSLFLSITFRLFVCSITQNSFINLRLIILQDTLNKENKSFYDFYSLSIKLRQLIIIFNLHSLKNSQQNKTQTGGPY